MSSAPPPDPLRRQLLEQLQSLRRAGVTHMPRATVVATAPSAASPASSSGRSPSAAPPSLGSSSPIENRSPVGNSPVAGVPGPAAPIPSVPVSSDPAMARRARSADSPAASAPGPRSAGSRTGGAAGPSRPPLPVLNASAGSPLPAARRQAAFEALDACVRECRLCPILVANRTQTVFGTGSLTPRLCFFGEAPGADEDASGVPFVGRAGQLLDKMIEAMTLKREEVYILNVLKCRPPDNRPPTPEEAENCRPFFEQQLEVLQPEFICCLGASAAQTLLRTKLSIGRLRGKFHDLGRTKVLATYHPAYLLRNPPAKKDVWADLQILMAAMGLKRG